jgi:hypothetical protein
MFSSPWTCTGNGGKAFGAPEFTSENDIEDVVGRC